MKTLYLEIHDKLRTKAAICSMAGALVCPWTITSFAQISYGDGSFNTGHAIGATPAYWSSSDTIYVFSGGFSSGDPEAFMFGLPSNLAPTPDWQSFIDP